MRWLRRGTQLAFLLLFLYLLLNTAYPLVTGLPVDLVLRFSLFMGVTASLAARTLIGQYWPALLLIPLTLVFGRVFCGWACPLGTTIDASDWALRKFRKQNADIGRARRFKYYLLGGLVVAAILGTQAAGWFDPLSIATRSYALVAHPIVYAGIDGITTLSYRFAPLEPIGDFVGSVGRSALSLQDPITDQPVFIGQLFVASMFVGILAAGVKYRRFWCRALCPFGALLGLLSRWSWARRAVGDDCISCRKCENVCPTEAITAEGKDTRSPECTMCMDCPPVCPVETISFVRRGQRKPTEATVDVTRRGVLAGIFGGIIAAPLLHLRLWQEKGRGNPVLIRPPGIDTEEEFLSKCVRCGECMKVCVTNGLQPVMLEGGLAAFMTPRLVPRVGYCAYECNICTQVCPSDAIKPLSLEEKQKVVLGKAFFDRSRCIPWAAYHVVSTPGKQHGVQWSDAFNCAVCEEHCPVPDRAIKFSRYPFRDGDPQHVINRPYVKLDMCIGCGICENKCPLPGPAAVRVTAVDQTNPDQPQRYS